MMSKPETVKNCDEIWYPPKVRIPPDSLSLVNLSNEELADLTWKMTFTRSQLKVIHLLIRTYEEFPRHFQKHCPTCVWGHRCCSKGYCELVIAESLKSFSIPYTLNDRGFMTDQGCSLPSYQRPSCTRYACGAIHLDQDFVRPYLKFQCLHDRLDFKLRVQWRIQPTVAIYRVMNGIGPKHI